MVDDDAPSRDALAALLRDHGYEVSIASGGIEAAAVVDRDAPDLVISDLRMPRGNGFELVKRLRSRSATVDLPIILVTAFDDPARRVHGLDLGADDYLAKPVDADELLARVRVHLRHAHRSQELVRRSVLDPLTGVLNRRGIVALLHRAQETARRSGSPLSVLMIDVDHFKALNDTHGHKAGDTALRQIARALVDAVRVADHVGRMGGDEFVVVVPDTGTAAEQLAERLRRLHLPPLAVAEDHELEISVSIGVATLDGDESLDTFLERADRAMYAAKGRGRGAGSGSGKPPPWTLAL